MRVRAAVRSLCPVLASSPCLASARSLWRVRVRVRVRVWAAVRSLGWVPSHSLCLASVRSLV